MPGGPTASASASASASISACRRAAVWEARDGCAHTQAVHTAGSPHTSARGRPPNLTRPPKVKGLKPRCGWQSSAKQLQRRPGSRPTQEPAADTRGRPGRQVREAWRR